MKKIISMMLALVLALGLCAFAAAEGADVSALTVTSPSGAPALALATLAVENKDNYTYIAADTIAAGISEKAVSGVDALLGRKPVGNKVIIVGGGLVGCEIAYGYAKEGKDVTIVEALDQILNLNNVPAMNKTMLLDGFEFYSTRILTNTKLKTVLDDGAMVVLPDGKEEKLAADTVILSIGYRPLPSLKPELEDCGAEVIEIGDGRKVGNVLTSVNDAHEVACKL